MMPMDEALRYHNWLSIAETLGFAFGLGFLLLALLLSLDRFEKGGKR